MKQVTMESIQKRIADLESAGKVVGGLSLSSEFELACLRELVAVTEQRDALVVENVALKAAIQEHSEGFIPCNCCGMEHDSSHDDVCRILNEIPATDAAIAALRAEGVEMAISHLVEKFNGTGIGVPVMALEHLARQLRESKGSDHE